jgi:hypothetical protein
MVPRQFVLATAAELRSTLRVTTAVTSTGRAVDQALVGVGATQYRIPGQGFPLDKLRKTPQICS